MDQESRDPTIDLELKVIHDWWAYEQTWFWQRFAGFAALEAGAIYVASTASEGRTLLCGVGIALSLAWLSVQKASLFYVKRAKTRYRAALEKAKIAPPEGYTQTPSTVMAWRMSAVTVFVWAGWTILSHGWAGFLMLLVVAGAWLFVGRVLPEEWAGSPDTRW